MARTRLASDIVADARQRADQENSTKRFPDTEVLEYVNQSIADLYDQLVRARGSDFFFATQSYVGDGATTMWALPATFFTLIGVQLNYGSGNYAEMFPFTEAEEAELQSAIVASSLVEPKYRLRASNLEIIPIMPVGRSAVLKFLPSAVRLTLAQSFDGYNGWEEFVVLDAARKIATKQQNWELVSALRADIQKIETRIAALAPKRDRGHGEKVQDTRAARRWGRANRWRLG